MYRPPGLIPLLCLLALGGCQATRGADISKRATEVTVEETEEWRNVASEADAQSIDALQSAWAQALASARTRYRRAVTAERALLTPETRLPRAAPTPGTYRCRAIRLGARTAKTSPWTVSKSGFCYVGVEDNQLSFASEIVGTRLGGYLWDVKEQDRLVFLGATVPARSKTAPAYGENAALDWAGLLERIGEYRYRLTLPRRTGDNHLIVLELTAAPDA